MRICKAIIATLAALIGWQASGQYRPINTGTPPVVLRARGTEFVDGIQYSTFNTNVPLISANFRLRNLYNGEGALSVDWSDGISVLDSAGQVSLFATSAQRQLQDTTSTATLDWDAKSLQGAWTFDTSLQGPTITASANIKANTFSSVATNRVAITATGYTNTLTVGGVAVDVDVYFHSATGTTISDSAGTVMYTYTTLVTQDTQAHLKPNWRLIGTSMAGTAIAR